MHVPEAQVLAELQARDAQDASRAAAPLRAAPDATVLDTTHLDADATFDRALKVVRDRQQRFSPAHRSMVDNKP